MKFKFKPIPCGLYIKVLFLLKRRNVRELNAFSIMENLLVKSIYSLV